MVVNCGAKPATSHQAIARVYWSLQGLCGVESRHCKGLPSNATLIYLPFVQDQHFK
jgi:hypothetical protein